MIIPGLVGHQFLTAADRPPRQIGLAYDYLVAANGVFLRAEGPGLALTVPYRRCALHGLAPCAPGAVLRHGPLPGALRDDALALCARHAARGEEAVALSTVDADGRYRLRIPEQEVTAVSVRFASPALSPGEGIVLHLHSHHAMPAYFSATDDRDEVGCALYAVVGRLGAAGRPPEVRVRAGINGHYLPIPWADVFAGGPGEVRDLIGEPPVAGPHAPPPAPCGDDRGGADDGRGNGLDNGRHIAKGRVAADPTAEYLLRRILAFRRG